MNDVSYGFIFGLGLIAWLGALRFVLNGRQFHYWHKSEVPTTKQIQEIRPWNIMFYLVLGVGLLVLAWGAWGALGYPLPH